MYIFQIYMVTPYEHVYLVHFSLKHNVIIMIMFYIV